jgi:hypothetical protein
LCFDLRFAPTSEQVVGSTDDAHNKVEFWLESIRSRAKRSPVVLLGTHADDQLCSQDHIDAVFRTMMDRFSERFGDMICAVAADDVSKSVDNSLIALEDAVLHPHVVGRIGETVPQCYLNFEELALAERETLNPPVMSWVDWVRMAEVAGVLVSDATEGTSRRRTEKSARTAAVARATQWLHELGSLIWFQVSCLFLLLHRFR